MTSENKHLILDGSMQIVRITEDLYEEAIQIYKDYFMKYENVSIATNLRGSKETIAEMEMLIREMLKDNVSFAAKDLQTGELAAISINKIFAPSLGCTLDEVFSRVETENMKYVGYYLHHMENTVDIYQKWNIECLFEIMFLSTRNSYAGKGLATYLADHSISFAKEIHDGTLSKDIILPKHLDNLKPQAVCAVFTGYFSQRIGQKLGFESIYEAPHTQFRFEGKTFAEKIDPIHEKSVFAAKLI